VDSYVESNTSCASRGTILLLLLPPGSFARGAALMGGRLVRLIGWRSVLFLLIFPRIPTHARTRHKSSTSMRDTLPARYAGASYQKHSPAQNSRHSSLSFRGFADYIRQFAIRHSALHAFRGCVLRTEQEVTE
jgi:hypothetical protein